MTWGKARKKPIIIEFREVEPKVSWGNIEWVETLEGRMRGELGKDFIIKGVEGELYPIDKGIFEKTYEVIQSPNQKVTEK